MSEPLITCTCRVCKKSYEYGGPEQKGYYTELCGPMCDGVEQGMRRTKCETAQSLREASSQVRDIARRVGVASSRDWIRSELVRLADTLELQAKPAHAPCER